MSTGPNQDRPTFDWGGVGAPGEGPQDYDPLAESGPATGRARPSPGVGPASGPPLSQPPLTPAGVPQVARPAPAPIVLRPSASAVQAGRSALGRRLLQLLVAVVVVTLVVRGVGFPLLFMLFIVGRRWPGQLGGAPGRISALWVRGVEVTATEVVVRTRVGANRYPAAEVLGFEAAAPSQVRAPSRINPPEAEVVLRLRTGAPVRLGAVRAIDSPGVEFSHADGVAAIHDLERRRRALQGNPGLAQGPV